MITAVLVDLHAAVVWMVEILGCEECRLVAELGE